jgi:hypothetical protein
MGSSHNHREGRHLSKQAIPNNFPTTVCKEQGMPRTTIQMMPAKRISLCEDETYHPEICLVAIEPVSAFSLVEQYAKHRDAQTLDQAIEQTTKGLPVKVTQSTSDEAKGILAHVREGLGANHSPDLFHAQHELQKATNLPLWARITAAGDAVEKAEKQRRQAEEEYQIFLAALVSTSRRARSRRRCRCPMDPNPTTMTFRFTATRRNLHPQ